MSIGFEPPLALIVNAGGQSRRMGQNKALLRLPPADTPLVVYVAHRLLGMATSEIVVVSNDAQVAEAVKVLPSVQVVADRWPGGGALGGIATGLAQCAGWAMMVACDMPLVDAGIFRKLAGVTEVQPYVDAVIPRIGGQAQPFHGLWHRRGLDVLEEQLAAGELAVHIALERLQVAWCDERALGVQANDAAFLNVNTPQEWEFLLNKLQESNGPVA